MSGKIQLKEMQKYYHEHVMAVSDKGLSLSAVCNFKENKIVYNVAHNIHEMGRIEVIHSLDEAVKRYNELMDV